MSKVYVGSLLHGCEDIAHLSVESLLSSELTTPTTFYLLDNGSPNREEIERTVLKPAIERALREGQVVEVHVNESNLGVSGGMNCLFRRAFSDPECEYFVYTAQDVIVHRQCVQNLVTRAEKGDLHFITAVSVPIPQPIEEPHAGEGVGALFMGHFLITRTMYEDIGGWDENFFPAYFEDNDFHARIVKGGYHRKAIGYCMATVQHRRSSTINKYPELNANFAKNSAYFQQKWGGDPPTVMRQLIDQHSESVPQWETTQDRINEHVATVGHGKGCWCCGKPKS